MRNKFRPHFISKIDKIGTNKLIHAIEEGEMRKIVNVFNDEDGNQVQVLIE